MITLMTKNEIISFLRQGCSESEIARRTKFSRTTVRKWAKTYKEALARSDPQQGTLEDFLCEKPKYDGSHRPKRKLDPTMIEYINQCLSENMVKGRTGRRKQRMKNKEEGAEAIFNHISLRTGHKSTIITTNLAFDRWNEIFANPILACAMVDRLTHRAYCPASSPRRRIGCR